MTEFEQAKTEYEQAKKIFSQQDRALPHNFSNYRAVLQGFFTNCWL